MKLKLDDIDVHYECGGQGRPLLLLHGNGGSCRSFDRVRTELEKRFECYAIDTRWHGKTKRGDRPFVYSQFACDLVVFVERLGLVRPHIIGYSDGGITALGYAARTHNVGRVVALGANWDASGTTPEFLSYAEGVLRRNRKWKMFPVCKRKIALTELMLKNENYEDWNVLGRIDCPVLLMAGDRDVIPAEHTARLCEAIKGAESVCVADCGHSIMREQPERFLELVTDFFSRDTE